MVVGVIGFWVLIAYIVRAITRDKGPVAPPAESALAILDRRLAAGEIGTEEYHQIRKTLSGGH